MRQVTRITRTSIIGVVAAAGGVIALGGGYAQADAGAHGVASGSPGVASGNSVQVPVHVPVNLCGNTVDVIGLLNPAMGNTCVNKGGSGGRHGGGHGATAGGVAAHSPGVGSGNVVQVPVDVPVNACGNSVDVIGVGNPAVGNTCANGIEPTRPTTPTTPPVTPRPPVTPPTNPGGPQHPGNPGTPPGGEHEHPGNPGPSRPNTPGAHHVTPERPVQELAQTGAAPLGLVVPVGAGMLLAGSVIYRRARRAA